MLLLLLLLDAKVLGRTRCVLTRALRQRRQETPLFMVFAAPVYAEEASYAEGDGGPGGR